MTWDDMKKFHGNRSNFKCISILIKCYFQIYDTGNDYNDMISFKRNNQKKLLEIVLRTDKNECKEEATHNCDTNAKCENTDGGFTCSCNSGYTGNGTVCEGKDLLFDMISYRIAVT